MDLYVLDANGEPRLERDMLTWSRFMVYADRHVALDEIGEVRVSTVFLGQAVLWETKVFGLKLDQTEERYASRADALAGHRRWVALVRDLVAQ